MVCTAVVQAHNCTGQSMSDIVELFVQKLRTRPEVGPAGACFGAVEMFHKTQCDCVVDLEVVLSSEKLEDCVQLWSSQGVDAALVANEIVVAESLEHLGLIHHEIRKLFPRLPDAFEPADLLGFGWRGLRMALRQYDPARGYKFSSFACPKINGSIRDGVRNEHHLPKRLTTFSRKVDAAAATLSAELTRAPTYDEIAQWMDLNDADRRVLPLLPPAKHLDEDRAGTEALLVTGEEFDPATAAELSARAEAVRDALQTLPEAVSSVVHDLYIAGHTVRQVAKDHNVSQRHVRTVRDDALLTMREQLAAWNS